MDLFFGPKPVNSFILSVMWSYFHKLVMILHAMFWMAVVYEFDSLLYLLKENYNNLILTEPRLEQSLVQLWYLD